MSNKHHLVLKELIHPVLKLITRRTWLADSGSVFPKQASHSLTQVTGL